MIKRISMIRLGISFFIGIVACLFSSCDNELDIRQAYPFMVETMPVQTKIVRGETAEIRCELKREVFRLYYTSASTDQQTIDIYVEDNFGQVVQMTFDFNNENGEKEEVRG